MPSHLAVGGADNVHPATPPDNLARVAQLLHSRAYSHDVSASFGSCLLCDMLKIGL